MNQDKSQAKLIEQSPISDQHKLIAYWYVQGKNAKEIAKALDYAESTVKKVLKDSKIKTFIKKVQYQLFGEDPALHIKVCASRGIEIAKEIMEDKKTKAQTRQEVAFKFMDRAYGKPGIEDGMVEGTVRKILQMLQKPIDTPSQETKNDIEYAEYSELPLEKTEVKEEPKEADKIDDWISSNIK